MLEQCKDLIDARMQEVNGIIVQLNDSSVLDDLMFRLNFNSGESSYEIMQLWKKISVFSLVNHFIIDFFIYQNKEEFLISPKDVYTHLSEVYGKQIKYGDMTLEQFKNTIFSKHNEGKYLQENVLKYKKGIQYDNKKVIAYLRSLPLNNYNSYGSIIFFIPTVNIQSIFQNMYTKDVGSYFIMDDSGKVLMSYPENAVNSLGLSLSALSDRETSKVIKDVRVNGKKNVWYQIRSSYNGLIYISIMPYSKILKRVASIESLLVGCLSVMFFTGLVLAYVMAYRNSKPISEIVNLLKSSVLFSRDVKYNDFDFLKGSISNLISTNTSLKNEIDHKSILLRNDFFGKLLRGNFINRHEIDTYLSHIRQEMPEAPYVAVIVYLRSYNNSLNEDSLRETSAVKLLLNSYFEQHFENMVCFYDYDFDKAVVLLSVFSGCMRDDKSLGFAGLLEDSMRNVCSYMKEHFNLGLSFAVGMQIDDIMHISDSVNTALRALQSNTLDEKIIWYSDLHLRPNSNYSIEMETKIINLARAGCYDEIEAILNNLFQVCFINNSPSTAMLKQFVYDLKGTVFQIATCDLPQDSLVTDKIHEHIDVLDHHMPYNEIWNELLKIYKKICSFFNEQKRSHNVQIGKQIQDYVLKNYRNQQLSLYSIACYFEMSEVYISQLFKEQIGQNFSDYLENIRIEEARYNLSNAELGIQTIAEMVGYNSAHTFSRAFKRVMGINPTLYRKTK